jgi:hypothetical protein
MCQALLEVTKVSVWDADSKGLDGYALPRLKPSYIYFDGYNTV